MSNYCWFNCDRNFFIISGFQIGTFGGTGCESGRRESKGEKGGAQKEEKGEICKV